MQLASPARDKTVPAGRWFLSAGDAREAKTRPMHVADDADAADAADAPLESSAHRVLTVIMLT